MPHVQDALQFVMTVADDVGLHRDDIPDDSLDGETAAVDLGPDAVDGDPSPVLAGGFQGAWSPRRQQDRGSPGRDRPPTGRDCRDSRPTMRDEPPRRYGTAASRGCRAREAFPDENRRLARLKKASEDFFQGQLATPTFGQPAISTILTRVEIERWPVRRR